MKGEKLLVTKKDIKRFKVLKDVIEKKLKGTQAAQLVANWGQISTCYMRFLSSFLCQLLCRM